MRANLPDLAVSNCPASNRQANDNLQRGLCLSPGKSYQIKQQTSIQRARSGVIFLRFVDQRFTQVERELHATVYVGSRRTRRTTSCSACSQFIVHLLSVAS